MITELIITGTYKDGGSHSLEDKKGNKYWQDFSLRTRHGESLFPAGIIYKGDININGRKNRAKGKFKIVKSFIKEKEKIIEQ